MFSSDEGRTLMGEMKKQSSFLFVFTLPSYPSLRRPEGKLLGVWEKRREDVWSGSEYSFTL